QGLRARAVAGRAVRSLIAAAALGLGAACARAPTCPNPTTAPQSAAPAELVSDPDEYRERPISREAGATYFGETGLGRPYAVGFPYPVLLALMRAHPEELGADWGAFAAKFGFLARGAELPVGFHLTTDPITGTGFVMTNCELCHAERLRTPKGELFVPGL